MNNFTLNDAGKPVWNNGEGELVLSCPYEGEDHNDPCVWHLAIDLANVVATLTKEQAVSEALNNNMIKRLDLMSERLTRLMDHMNLMLDMFKKVTDDR